MEILSDLNTTQWGKRTAKIVTPANSNNPTNYTLYAKDAQGNTLATYNYTFSQSNQIEDVMVEERNLFGSSRLGVDMVSFKIIDNGVSQTPDSVNLARHLGYKRYELTNHLGNVMSVVSDRKLIGQDAYSNLSFNGSNQWVDCGTSDRGVTNEVTLEAWVKTSYNSNTSKLVVAKFPHTSAIKNGYTLVLNFGKIDMHGRVHPNYI